jgi:hypothetical protein
MCRAPPVEYVVHIYQWTWSTDAHGICDQAFARGLRVDAIVPGITKVGL